VSSDDGIVLIAPKAQIGLRIGQVALAGLWSLGYQVLEKGSQINEPISYDDGGRIENDTGQLGMMSGQIERQQSAHRKTTYKDRLTAGL
jgi:hypothetical protein